jgi:hypothetical protein
MVELGFDPIMVGRKSRAQARLSAFAYRRARIGIRPMSSSFVQSSGAGKFGDLSD